MGDRIVFTALLCLLLCLPSADSAADGAAGASQDGERRLEWTWRRHHAADYTATALFGATGLAMELVSADRAPRWSGGVPFDDSLRSALVLGNYDDRRVAARVSDVTLVALLTNLVVVDGLLVTWAGHGADEVAWQMLAIDLESLAVAYALTNSLKRAVGRERPTGTACRTDASYDRRCETQSHRWSMPSGHASLTFTAATLSCLHHAQLGLYGRAGDALACATNLLAASSVAFERMLADRHYATDVMAGAALGALSGALLPWALFYAHPRGQTEHAAWSVGPGGVAGGLGLVARGWW